MRIVRLFVIGEGIRALEVSQGATLAQIATGEGLTEYDFKIDDVDVPRTAWATTSLDSVKAIWASRGVKGA